MRRKDRPRSSPARPTTLTPRLRSQLLGAIPRIRKLPLKLTPSRFPVRPILRLPLGWLGCLPQLLPRVRPAL